MIHLESKRKKHSNGRWRAEARKDTHDGPQKDPGKTPKKVLWGEGN
jgi:hypothetical protein